MWLEAIFRWLRTLPAKLGVQCLQLFKLQTTNSSILTPSSKEEAFINDRQSLIPNSLLFQFMTNKPRKFFIKPGPCW